MKFTRFLIPSSLSKKKTLSLIACLMLFFSSNIFAQFPGNDNVAGAGKNYNIPANVTSVTAQVWGSGGSGGGSTTNGNSGSGAGGGGYTTKTFAVTPGDLITYTVGAGATATAAGNNGNNGNLSSLAHVPSTTILTGNGGGRGNANSGTGGTGGTGTGGSTNTNGANGGAGATTVGGNGGDGGNAAGTGGLGQTNANGLSGTIPGGGGGGGEFGGGASKAGGAGANGQVTLTFISVSSITPNPVCTGSTITITGTNFASGVSSVSINGTPCTSVTWVNATTITAVVAAGTTSGVVLVTNPNGTNNGKSITVNASPTITSQPTSTSICTTGTGTFTVTASGAITGYQWRRNGVNLTNTAPYSGVTTATLTITNPSLAIAGNFDVVISTAAPCSTTSNVAVLTVTDVPTIATTPTPTNASTGICYAGTGATTSVSWTAVGTATSYDVYFGAGSLPGSVTANVATNTYNTGTLLANTTYFWKVVAKNSCGSAVGSSTWTFTTAAIPCGYCTPAHSVSCGTPNITNVTFNTINNNSTCANTNGTSYTNYALTGTPTTTVFKSFSYNLTITVDASAIASAWIDYNQNGVFEATEWAQIFTTGTTGTVNITIPAGATSGATVMRIRTRSTGNTNGSGDSCTSFGSGETEDYKITIAVAAPCTTPTAQPTALVLTPTVGGLTGSFTAAAPAPDGYVVVVNTTGVTPTPTNGTTYTIGSTMGAGNTVIASTTGTTFSSSSLMANTLYYVYVFSNNQFCTGGPLYLGTSPLNGSTTTLSGTYCTPSVSAAGYENVTYFTNISFVGTLLDTSNNSTFSSAPRGYQDFTGLATLSQQAQGEGVNISTQTTNRGYMKAWVDWNKDGDFNDSGENVYSSGNVATYSTTFGFVIPATQPVGNYRVRIRINKDDNIAPIDPGAISTFDSCQVLAYYGETEDYLFTVIPSCNALITSVTNGSTCGPGTATLAATGNAGVTQFKWYAAATGGAPLATTATGSWTTPSISSTTNYYVTAVNGTCESLVRTLVVATYNPTTTLSFTPSSPEVCGENVVVSITASGDTEQAYLINENFEGGMGGFTNANYINNGATVNANAAWQSRTSTYVPVNPPGQVWFPAISSGFGTNKFVSSTSDLGSYQIHTALVSPTVDSSTFTDLTLTFDAYYSRYYIDGSNLTLDYVTVDVSTNGGASWIEIQRYTGDIAIGTRMQNLTYNLSAYINQPNLKVRIRYYGEWCDGIAIDNVKLFGTRPLNTAFTWSGGSLPDAFTDAACTIPYVAGTPIVTVYVKPTLTQLEQGTYTFTASATLSNGCSASTPITITNKSRVWKGTTSTNWNDPTNWLPVGVPDSSNCVIIPANSIITGSGYNAYGKNLTVKTTGNLDLQSSNNLTITEWIKVEGAGIFNVRNTANLVQINNVANTGNIRMERTTNIRKLDYVYWSSPVASFSSSAISPGTTGYIYKWIPTIGANLNGWGNWTSGIETMTLGKGYIVRGPDAFTSALQSYTATFVGVPNNGTITTPISRGTYNGVPYVSGSGSTTLATLDDDNWNLLGNPYPSAINPTSFLAANTNIAGFVKIWTHGTLPSGAISDPYYADYVSNYTAGDYITYNGSGSTAGPGVNNIAAGQGFFTLMNHTSAATSETVTFSNSMRFDGSGNPYSNNQFYKNVNNHEHSTEADKNRIWIDLINPSNKNIRTLLGYVSDATNNNDRLFDAKSDEKMSFNFYSLLNEEPQTIQGRQLPFDSNDMVDFGFKTDVNGIHTIAIVATDGLFDKNKIYLEDKELHIIHDLSKAPYTFQANSGVNNTRFRVRFNKGIKTESEIASANETKIYATNSINISSNSKKINSVAIYDMLGKTLFVKDNVSQNDFTINEVKKSNSILIVKIILENGEIISEKIKY